MTPRVLISGATGFLGLPCVRRLAALGAEVHAAARQDRGELPAGVRFHAIDLFDEERVGALADEVQPTHLLHLAWIATPGVYWTARDNWLWVTASMNVLEAVAAFRAERAVIAGTCAEYDWSGAGRCHEDKTPIQPTTIYGRAKNHLQNKATEFALNWGLSLAWARLFFLYGPREHPARLVPSVARGLLAGEVAECTAGTQERDFLHVDDAADALVALLLGDVTRSVNVASGEPVAVRSVVETVAAEVGRPDLLRLGARPIPSDEPPRLVADVRRLRDEVGWQPRIGLREGIAETVAWWRENRAA